MRVGEFLPESLRASATETNVVVLVHSPECAECRGYVAALNTIADEFRVWEARLLVRSAAGREAGIIIADRYGQLFYTFTAGPKHELPGLEVVAEALKFLGTLCPE